MNVKLHSSPYGKRPLGEVADVISGFAFKSTDFGDKGIPVIKIKNIRLGHVDLNEASYVDEKHLSIPDRFHVKSGDVLISLTGSHITQPNSVVGRIARHSDGQPRCLLNQRAGKIIAKDKRVCDPRFLFYALSEQETMLAIAVKAHGAASQANVSPSQVESIEISFPPLPVQQRIAGILSAYDELIENSQRRIKILEAMARGLYREWFVHFRFPGHENHPPVVSPLGDIPRGWEATTLGTNLAALESGKRPKGGIREEADGVPSIGAENINGIGKHEFASEKLVPREFFEQMRKGVVRDRDVAIYKDGAYIGKSSYFRDAFPHTEFCVNEHVFLLRGKGIRLKQNFLYIWLQEPETVQAIRSKNANAAQPGINQQTLGGLELVLPDEKTAVHFDRSVEPLLAEIINLAKRIQNLRRTRDLLLPRLLSGQIDIGEI
jgi:type I restriction enzyme S subunit